MQPLRQIYGDEAHLFKDKLIFKMPGMTGYAMHQDYISWKSFPESFITVIVAIDPTDAENGATEVFGGYHSKGYMSDRDGDYHELALDKVDLSRGTVLDLAPGDVAFFSGFTPIAPPRTSRTAGGGNSTSATTPARTAASSATPITANSTSGWRRSTRSTGNRECTSSSL